MKIKEVELNRWELAEFSEESFLTINRDDSVLLVWTPLNDYCDQGLNFYVLNIFSPHNQYFWNFSGHHTFCSFQHKFFNQYLISSQEKGDLTKKILVDLIKETGQGIPSFFSSILLKGVTGYFGDYFSEPVQVQNRFFYHHCISWFVPFFAKDFIYNYIKSSLEQFGTTAFKSVNEKVLCYTSPVILGGTYSIDNLGELGELVKLLNSHQINNYLTRVDYLLAEKRLSLCPIYDYDQYVVGSYQSFINYINNRQPFNDQIIEWTEVVSKFRLNWAIKNYPVCDLISIKENLLNNMNIFMFPELTSIKYELLKIINDQLINYPILYTNPLAFCEFLNIDTNNLIFG